MFIVFFDRPYYPSVVGTYPSEAEARAAALKTVEETRSEDGKHQATVYVCEVVAVEKLKTDH